MPTFFALKVLVLNNWKAPWNFESFETLSFGGFEESKTTHL